MFSGIMICLGIGKAQGHCLDTETVVRHFTKVGVLGILGFTQSPRPPLDLRVNSKYHGFWPLTPISLGSGTGIDDTHECSIKRATMCGHRGPVER